ncbi:MAG: D-alanyl-D-alanine carboxypeptidase [Bacilli bacterium]|nr:D-alanyl-D-alanine carboxypeptidase [Bacilli bacterium]
MKKIILFLLVIFPINVFAIADHAKSSILIESSTGTIILENNSNEKASIASMTKMMTLLIIMEYLDNGKISLSDMVPISDNAASMGGSQVYLSPNSKMPLEVLLKSVSIASANDSAVALAEYVAGSTEKFVELMNKRSEEIGLTNTHFMNVHGLDEENHYSTAYDMAMIARELVKHEKILEYSSKYEDYVTHPDGTNTWIVNTNKLINYYPGLDGLKTGFTNTAGYCITATAKRGNMRLISVVMGEENNKVRNQDTMELLNYGFSNYKMETILKKDDVVGSINIEFGSKKKVDLVLKSDCQDLVSILEENNYSYEIIKNKIKAPVKKGDVVGKINLYSGNTKISEFDLTVKENVRKSNFFELFINNLVNLTKGYY